MSKILNTRIQQKYDKESNWATVESSYIPYNGELVVYSFDTDEPPEVKIGDGESVLEDLPFIYDADVPIPDPVLVGTYTYNGQGITPQFDVDLEKVNANIPTKINAGTYTKENGGAASFTPKTGYMWQDGTSTTKYIEWTINKATVTATITGHYQYSHAGGNVAEIYVSYSPDVNTLYPAEGVYDVYPELTSSNQSVIPNGTYMAVSAIGFNPEISLAGSGTANITLTYPATNNVNAFTTNTYSITVTGVASNDLKANTWEEISTIAEKGLAGSYWEIGDYKQIENSIMPNACAFIVDMHPSQGIMFEINANTSVDTSSNGTRYAFTKNYYSVAEWIQTAGHGYYAYNGFHLCSDFDTEDGNTYTWGAATAGNRFYYNDPLYGELDSIYYAMGTSIKPYIKPVIETFKDYDGSWPPPNYTVNCTSYVTIATPFQLGFTGSDIDNTGSYCSWNKQFEFYLNGNIKQKRGSYVKNGKYQTVSGYTNVEYWLRPLSYDSGYPYVNTSGGLSRTFSGAGPDGTTSRGICPIFRMGPNI